MEAVSLENIFGFSASSTEDNLNLTTIEKANRVNTSGEEILDTIISERLPSTSSTTASTIGTFLSTTFQSILTEVVNSSSNSNTSSIFNLSTTGTSTAVPVPSTLSTTTSTPYLNLSSTATPCPCANSTPANSVFNTTPHAMFNNTLNSSSNATEMVPMMESVELVLTVIPLSLISLLIIFGNLLVIIAVFTQKSLRSPQNIYIVSLAAADMAVGLVILPFSIAYLVLRRWVLGEFFCKVWLTGDVALCCVSIFHLCAIGIDRYRAITDGINYVQRRNLKSVLWTVGVLWMLAVWIGSPPLMAMNDWRIIYDGNKCSMPLNVGYAVHLAIGALFFPLIIMSVIYLKIYGAIKERLKERARVTCIELTSDADTTDRLDSEAGSLSTDDNLQEQGKSVKREGGTGKRKQSAQISTFLVNKQKFSLSRERKAARTLGIIMGAFIVCWLPLGFLNTIGAMLPDEYQPSDGIFHALTWLGYVNSALNPIIYAISNQEFQKAFRRVLHMN